jgi:hypothetical protein
VADVLQRQWIRPHGSRCGGGGRRLTNMPNKITAPVIPACCDADALAAPIDELFV